MVCAPAALFNPATGSFGTMQKNSVYGPGFAAVDFSVFKNIPVKEKMKVQVRAEMFNVFNHVNLAAPSSRVGSSLGLIGWSAARLIGTAGDRARRTV